MGLDAAVAGAALDGFTTSMPVLTEVPDIGPRWRRVVEQFSVISKQAHDARLIALMEAHGIDRILTMNAKDFARFNHISILTPADVLASPNP